MSEFLYPTSAQVLKLENLRPDELLNILPRSTLGERDTLALFSYQDPLVKEIIWEIKYKGNRTLAKSVATLLYDVIMDELQERNVFEKYETVTLLPMPTSDQRRLERGWNQAEILTSAVKALDAGGRLQYLPRELIKVRYTESQTKTTTKKERLANLQDSMQVQNPAMVSGQFVVLIDDVTTTGATLNEAKRALHLAGARSVLCIAVAH